MVQEDHDLIHESSKNRISGFGNMIIVELPQLKEEGSDHSERLLAIEIAFNPKAELPSSPLESSYVRYLVPAFAVICVILY
jgi:hypothetical protein